MLLLSLLLYIYSINNLVHVLDSAYIIVCQLITPVESDIYRAVTINHRARRQSAHAQWMEMDPNICTTDDCLTPLRAFQIETWPLASEANTWYTCDLRARSNDQRVTLIYQSYRFSLCMCIMRNRTETVLIDFHNLYSNFIDSCRILRKAIYVLILECFGPVGRTSDMSKY